MMTDRLRIENTCFKRHTLLSTHEGQLWRIHCGMVRAITWDDQGQIAPLGFWGKGSIIGSQLNPITPYEFECLNSVEVEPLVLEGQIFTQTLLTHIHQSGELMRILHCRRVEVRLLQLIDWFAQNFGTRSRDRIYMELPLTHQQIAESISSTRVTVTRLIRQFELAKTLQWSRHHQVVYLNRPKSTERWLRPIG
ncbi:MAG: Crp/Fnr family transcriptional regulator [Cyanobacteria bacterium J06659_2]